MYGKQQTSVSSREFLKVINSPENCYGANLCVEIMNNGRQAKGKLGHVVQIRVCHLT